MEVLGRVVQVGKSVDQSLEPLIGGNQRRIQVHDQRSMLWSITGSRSLSLSIYVDQYRNLVPIEDTVESAEKVAEGEEAAVDVVDSHNNAG